MEFGFNEFQKPSGALPQPSPEVKLEEKKDPSKKTINFQELPKDSHDILSAKEMEEYSKEEQIGLPYDDNQQHSSYLSLVLSPNLRDLELMIRGLEYV